MINNLNKNNNLISMTIFFYMKTYKYDTKIENTILNNE
jgi:hypothetical protein